MGWAIRRGDRPQCELVRCRVGAINQQSADRVEGNCNRWGVGVCRKAAAFLQNRASLTRILLIRGPQKVFARYLCHLVMLVNLSEVLSGIRQINHTKL